MASGNVLVGSGSILIGKGAFRGSPSPRLAIQEGELPTLLTWGSLSAIALLSLFYLLPTISAGFSGPDVALAHAKGFADYEGLDFWTAFRAIREQLRAEQGGWLPLADFQVVFWLLKPTAPLARTIQMMFVLADITTFVLLVARVSKSLRLAVLSGVGVVATIQLRQSHDAILGGTFGIPEAFLLGVLSLLAFQSWIDRGSFRWLVVAFALETIASGLSEISWVMSVAFPVLATTLRGRARYGWLFPLVPLAYIAIAVGLHAPVPASLRWLLHPGRSDLTSVAIDLVGALPTSYRAFENIVHDGLTGFTADNRFESIPRISIFGLLSVLGLFAMALIALSPCRHVRISRDRFYALATFAFMLWLAGALFHEPLVWKDGIIRLGQADPAVFLGSFGVGLILAGIGYYGLHVRAVVVAPAVALALCLLSYGNVRANERVVVLARDRHETWHLIDEAGSAGIFARFSNEAIVVFDGPPPLPVGERSGFRDFRYFIYQTSRKRIRVASVREIRPGGRLCAGATRTARSCVSRAEVWIIRRNRMGPFAGGLTIGRWVGSKGGTLLVNRAIGFRLLTSGRRSDPYVSTLGKDRRGMRVSAWSTNGNRVVVDIERRCAPVDIARAFRPDGPDLRYGRGFEPPDLFRRYQFGRKAFLHPSIDGSQDWRYGESRAFMEVRPDSCGGKRLYLTGTIVAFRPNVLTISAGKNLYRVTASATASALLIPIEPADGKAIDVAFLSQGPAAPEAPGPPFDLRRFPPAHFVLKDARVTIDQGS